MMDFTALDVTLLRMLISIGSPQLKGAKLKGLGFIQEPVIVCFEICSKGKELQFFFFFKIGNQKPERDSCFLVPILAK